MTTKEAIELTKQLIAIPSTADNAAALRQAVDFVADIVARQCTDVTIERFERNGRPSLLAYRGTARPAEFDIMLNAHVDVVPAKTSQFTPRVSNNRLYGRGALDMKGTAIALTNAFCEQVATVPYNLALQIASDEEIGGYDGVRLQMEQGVRTRFVVIGEYANHRDTIYNAARGLCWITLGFKGRTAHGAHLWHGSNALLKATAFAHAVLERYPTPNKETWATTANIADLSTKNTAYNKVPDEATLKIDFRFTEEDHNFEDEASLKTFIASIDPTAEILEMATFEPAVNVTSHNPFVQGLSKAFQSANGRKPAFLSRPGGSDGRHFALVNIDCIEFGMYGQGSHGDQEYVELDSYEEYMATMHAFLRDPVPAGIQRSLLQTVR